MVLLFNFFVSNITDYNLDYSKIMIMFRQVDDMRVTEWPARKTEIQKDFNNDNHTANSNSKETTVKTYHNHHKI